MQKFRLATLLKIREQERDQAAQRVMDARNAIEKLQSSRKEVLEENDRMNTFRKESSQGAVNMQNILESQRFQMLLMAQVQQLDDHLGKLQQELERRESVLLQAQQSVKSLEKLRDQKIEKYQSAENHRMQERTDEWASVRFAKDIQSTSHHP